MVNASCTDLAFSSILHDVLSVLFGPFQTGNRATGFKVFLNHISLEIPKLGHETVTGSTSLISNLKS